MLTLTRIQHCTGSPSQSNQAIKGNKRHPTQKGRRKILGFLQVI